MGGGGGGQRKDDGMKNSVMNPDRYSPSKARELGLINDKEYAKRQTAAQGIEPVYPELFLTPAGAARGVGGAVARDAVGGAVKNIAGREVVPAAGNVVKNTVGRDVVPAGGNVTKNVAGRDVVPAGRDVVNTPKLNTIDAPPQLTGPTANTTKQIGRNDPNVIDVTAKDITNRPQLTTNAPRDTRDMFPDAAHDFYYPKKPPPMDLTKPIAAVAAPAIVGAGLYGINQSMQPPVKAATDKDATTAKPPSADQLPKAQGTLPNGTAGQRPTPSSDVIAAQRNAAASTSPAPINTKYQGSAAAQKLAADNNIANPNDIKVGQVINLGGDQTHTVKKGDTLDKIAAKSSSSVPSPSAVVQPSAPATTFSQDVDQNKAKAAASTPAWAKPVNNPTGPADNKLDIPNFDELDRITNLAGISPKSSTVPTSSASEPTSSASPPPASNAAAQNTAAGDSFTADTTARMLKARDAIDAPAAAPAPVAEPPAPSTTLKTLEPTEPITAPKIAPTINASNGEEEVTKENQKISRFSFLRGL
jgi:hypothetical protein